MKITKELLKQIIKEEIAALNEKSLRPGEMTPEQESLRNKKVLQFLKDPDVQKLQGKYGIFLSTMKSAEGSELLDFFGLTVMQQNMKSPVRSLSDVESDTIAVVKQQLKNLQQQKNLVDPATQRTIADLKQKIEKLQQKK